MVLNINMSIIYKTLDMLRGLYPISGVIQIGFSGAYSLKIYEDLDVTNAVFIDANHHRVESIASTFNEELDWRAYCHVIGENDGFSDFYIANNVNESGIVSPTDLKPIWPNLKISEHLQRRSFSLQSFFYEHEEHLFGADFNFLSIQCFPALSLLRGAGQLLETLDIIDVRVLLDQAVDVELSDLYFSEINAYLTDKGFVHLCTEVETNQAIGNALFVRDFQSAAKNVVLNKLIGDKKERINQQNNDFHTLIEPQNSPNHKGDIGLSLQILLMEHLNLQTLIVEQQGGAGHLGLANTPSALQEKSLTIENLNNVIAKILELWDNHNGEDEHFLSQDLRALLDILKSENEILTHELTLLNKQQANKEVSNKSTNSLKIHSYSQLGQDLWVIEQTAHKKNGFFVEFGATNGVLLSNTYLLEQEFDWTGICAEPNPKFYKELIQNRNCIVSDDCIGPKTGEQVSFVLADVYGGIQDYAFVDKHSAKREAYQDMGDVIEVTTISLNEFLLKHKAPPNIDYLSIDTEGSEYDILVNFPFENWNIKLMTVEHNNSDYRDSIRGLLISKNYEIFKEAGFEDWFCLK